MCLAATLLLTTVLAASPAAAAAPQPGAAGPKPGAAAARPAGIVRLDKGVRFTLPAGYQVTEKVEQEPNEPDDLLFVARLGAVEIRVEVEPGKMTCAGMSTVGQPRLGGTDERPTCEVELPAPPSLDPKAVARRSATVMVQFKDRFLSVVVFAPDQARATRLARQVAASAIEP